jgi:pimeloyl-ACP methyl ester carboxylesterase
VYQKIKLLDHLPRISPSILFDRRECVQSGGWIEPITWSHYVAQGKGLLEQLHISRAHLMGGCMGCAQVAAFCRGSPGHGREPDPVLAGRRRQIQHANGRSRLNYANNYGEFLVSGHRLMGDTST